MIEAHVGEFVRIGRTLPAPRLVRRFVPEGPHTIEHRAGAVVDALSLPEIAGRIAGLQRLRGRCLVEHRRLLAAADDADFEPDRRWLLAEAAAVARVVDGVLDEVGRLRALAGLLRTHGTG